jgi:hypothetical protein
MPTGARLAHLGRQAIDTGDDRALPELAQDDNLARLERDDDLVDARNLFAARRRKPDKNAAPASCTSPDAA